MKTVIYPALATVVLLSLIFAAYRLGEAGSERYMAFPGVDNKPVKLDRRTGQMWYTNFDAKLVEYATSGDNPNVPNDMEVPQDVIDSLKVIPNTRSPQSGSELRVLIYNPTDWMLNSGRLKVIKKGATPEEGWERIYRGTVSAVPEGLGGLSIDIGEEVTPDMEMQLVSARGIILDNAVVPAQPSRARKRVIIPRAAE